MTPAPAEMQDDPKEKAVMTKILAALLNEFVVAGVEEIGPQVWYVNLQVGRDTLRDAREVLARCRALGLLE